MGTDTNVSDDSEVILSFQDQRCHTDNDPTWSCSPVLSKTTASTPKCCALGLARPNDMVASTNGLQLTDDAMDLSVEDAISPCFGHGNNEQSITTTEHGDDSRNNGDDGDGMLDADETQYVEPCTPPQCTRMNVLDENETVVDESQSDVTRVELEQLEQPFVCGESRYVARSESVSLINSLSAITQQNSFPTDRVQTLTSSRQEQHALDDLPSSLVSVRYSPAMPACGRKDLAVQEVCMQS